MGMYALDPKEKPLKDIFLQGADYDCLALY